MPKKRENTEAQIELKGNKTQELAYNMYESGDYTQLEIADFLGLDNKTITAWKQKYGWEERKTSALQTDSEIIKKLKKSLKEELEKTPLNADNVSKLNTALKSFSDRKVLASQGISVLSKYMNYLIISGKQELGKQVAASSPDFIKYLLDNE